MSHVWAPLTVAEVGTLLSAAEGRWWLSGGCAFDVWLGYQSREHGDIDVSVLRSGWALLADAIPDHLETFAAEDGALRPLEGPLVPRSVHNIWIRDRDTRSWVLQANLEEGDDRRWAYRRHPSVTRGWEEAVWSSAGLAVFNPAVQLLWKAADPSEKDERDFELVAATLPAGDVSWLVAAIREAHPTSGWVGRLESG